MKKLSPVENFVIFCALFLLKMQSTFQNYENFKQKAEQTRVVGALTNGLHLSADNFVGVIPEYNFVLEQLSDGKISFS